MCVIKTKLPGQMSGVLLAGSNHQRLRVGPIELLTASHILRRDVKMQLVVVNRLHKALIGIPKIKVDNRETGDDLKRINMECKIK